MNSTTNSQQSLTIFDCSTIIIPFLLPFVVYFIALLFNKILNLFYIVPKDIFQTQNDLCQFAMIINTVYFWYVKVSYQQYRNDTYSNLSIEGWYTDYLGVLLSSFLIYLRFIEKYTILPFFSLIIFSFSSILIIPGFYITVSLFILYINHKIPTNTTGSYKSIIAFVSIALFQSYKWISLVLKYDFIFNKCFLGGFIDLSTTTSVYITILMILVYLIQVILFAKTIKYKWLIYLLSVIAFTNGTIAICLYMIYYEIYIIDRKKKIR